MSDTAIETESSNPAPAPEAPAINPFVKPGAEPVGEHAPEIRDSEPKPFNEKPEYVPDKFWNAEAREVKTEDALKAYAALEQAYNTKTETLRTDVERSFHEERLQQRPEAPSDYNAQPPEGFLPEDASFTVDEENPMMKFWRDTAHKNGLSQTEFEQGIAAFIDNVMHDAPNPDKVVEALGQNGQERFDAVHTWVSGRLGENALQHFGPLLGSTDGITLLENVIGMTKDFQQGGVGQTSAPKGPLTQEQIEQKMKDPRYADPYKREPSFVQEVMNDWKQLKPDPEEQLQKR